LTVRYFPKFAINCYTLTDLKVGFKYLIRALFYYRNYDNLNKPPYFYIYLGLDRWGTVDASSDDLSYAEMIFIATNDNVQVCLVNVNFGVPFISSIHLRQLNSSMYPLVDLMTSLTLSWRYNLGASNRQLVRSVCKDSLISKTFFPLILFSNLFNNWKRFIF
jgi:Malectin-like domain